MLDRAVRELKGEARSPRTGRHSLNLGISVRIDSHAYIPEKNQRLRMYKRAAGVEDEAALDDVRKELQDRYGEPPAPVRYLLSASALKLLCERVGVLAIDRKRDSVTIKFTEQAAIEPERLARFVAQARGAQFSPGGVLKFNLKSTQPEELIDQLNGLLRELSPEVVARRGYRQSSHRLSLPRIIVRQT